MKDLEYDGPNRRARKCKTKRLCMHANPAFSGTAIWSVIFEGSAFSSYCYFMVRHFPVLQFQPPPPLRQRQIPKVKRVYYTKLQKRYNRRTCFTRKYTTVPEELKDEDKSDKSDYAND